MTTLQKIKEIEDEMVRLYYIRGVPLTANRWLQGQEYVDELI